MKFPVFDLHCDTAFRMLTTTFDGAYPLTKNELHIDLERAGKFPGYAQCFACFTSDEDTLRIPVSPETLFEREKAVIIDALNKNCHLIRQAFNDDDILRNLKNGVMSAILTIEGPAGFGYDPAALEGLYDLGFRITTLGWNESSPLAGSHITGEGLSELGKEYVHQAQRLGMLIDISHISDNAFWDIMSITSGPIIATHSNSRSVWNVSRNITDEMFLAVCRTGGVVGINLYRDFLGEDPDVDTVCDHILHFLQLDPDGKHIALGGDLDGCDALPKGFNGVQDYPLLAERLLLRGLDERTVYNIFWNNALEVIKNAVSKH